MSASFPFGRLSRRRASATTLALAAAAGIAAAADAQAVAAGTWTVTSTVTVLSVPGVPGFLQRMARGRSSAERKHVPSGQGIEALLAPDPKAHCRIDAQQLSGGDYRQVLTCPQKGDEPIHIVRTGRYDANGFAGDATVDGATGRGTLHIVLHQTAKRIGD